MDAFQVQLKNTNWSGFFKTTSPHAYGTLVVPKEIKLERTMVKKSGSNTVSLLEEKSGNRREYYLISSHWQMHLPLLSVC